MTKKQPEVTEMTQEEAEKFFGELEEDQVPDFDLEGQYEPNTIIMHCKPVYNFQSIEFDVEVDVNNPEDMESMKGIYSAVLNILQSVAVDQPAQVKPRTKPKPEDRPTESQIYIMDKFGIKHDDFTTKKEAQDLIDESIKKNKEKSK